MADNPNKPKSSSIRLWLLLILIVLLIVLLQLLRGGHDDHHLPEAGWFEFEDAIAAGAVSEIAFITEGPGTFVRVHFEQGPGGDWKESAGYLTPEVMASVRANQIKHSFHEHVHPKQGLLDALFEWIPFVLVAVFLLVVFVTLLQRGGPNITKLMVPPTRELPDDDPPVTFDDVVGCDTAKTALRDAMAAVTAGDGPGRRVLLSGPTGCGKTMLIRAVAAECKAAEVTFRYLIGADFVEVFVGVGAARVKRLFAEAKPGVATVIVIDAVDAVAKRRERNTGSLEGEEREQALGQLLEALDGFSPPGGHLGVILTTNRADMVDEALVRPGRIDRVVEVSPPGPADREELLRRHGITDATVAAHAASLSADWSSAAVVALAQAAVRRANGATVTTADVDAAMQDGFGPVAQT